MRYSTAAPAASRKGQQTGLPSDDDRRLHIPDVVRVLLDRAIRRKYARVGDVDRRRLEPRSLILVLAVHVLVRPVVRAEILQHEELVVALNQVIAQRVEITVGAVDELRDDEAHGGVRVVLVPRLVAARRVVIQNLFCTEAKDLAVLATDRLADLNVRAVERAERQSTVHHELHIARA